MTPATVLRAHVLVPFVPLFFQLQLRIPSRPIVCYILLHSILVLVSVLSRLLCMCAATLCHGVRLSMPRRKRPIAIMSGGLLAKRNYGHVLYTHGSSRYNIREVNLKCLGDQKERQQLRLG